VNNLPPRFDSLTSIRFLAAVAVYLYHCRHLFGLIVDSNLENPVDRGLGLGFLGVPFFFTLSGFILSVVYAARMPVEQGKGSNFDLRGFLIARIARVYPMYIACLIPAIPLLLADSRDAPLWSKAVAVVTTPILAQAWIPSSALLWNPVGWSLSVEAFLYLLFPTLLRGMMGGSSLRPFAVAGASLIVGAAVLVGIAWIAPETGTPGPFATPASAMQKLARYSPALHLPAFIGGIAAALFYIRQNTSQTATRGLVFCIAGVAYGATAAIASNQVPHLHLHNWMLTPGFGLLLIGLAMLDNAKALPRVPFLNLLGEASYAFYLTHLITIRLYLKIVERVTGDPASGWAHTIGCLVLATFISIACHLWIERPMRRAVLHWAGQSLRPAPPMNG
jgi:peptidoglycan/LPS O-acetylase OafA/YrhL